MAITNSARKKLWGRAGGVCSRCKINVFEAFSDDRDPVVTGKECHIVARSDGGPRADSALRSDARDNYENLILLCGGCHDIIDSKPDIFPVYALEQLKESHEEWVREKLSSGENTEGMEDLELLRTFYPYFDRYAFRDPMSHEEPYSFIQAIRDTRFSLSTGFVRFSDGQIQQRGSPKALLKTHSFRRAFDSIVDLLRQIERNWDAAIMDGTLDRGRICYDEEFLASMDETRNQIITTVNAVFVPLGYQGYPMIESPEKRSRGHTTGYIGGTVVSVDNESSGLGFFGDKDREWIDQIFGSVRKSNGAQVQERSATE